MSGKQLRYQTRYQTRSNNSPEESPDDDDDNDEDDDDNNNFPSNRQPNQPPPPPPPVPPNQNMDRGGNNPPDGRQNAIMAQALTALVQALENMQPAPAQASKEQNIAQVPKFHGYENEDPVEWAKRFDAVCLTNN